MKVRSTQLLFVLAALWLMAGVSILSVGIAELLERHDWWIVVGALAIFAVFSTVIFPRVIRRYSTRVADMDGGPHHLWEALDMKGYLFMVVMMGLGIALRMSGLAPDWFIAS
ncbi:MAG: hypothetical protein LBI64_01180, partial [Coriobacteriales bacterium]|nr:hypothetical protein [Coriobacteriales bacterium]